MLEECSESPSRGGGGSRRWFSDDFFDLILWHSDEGAITAFQLCYAKRKAEHAVVWSESDGCTHQRVLSGDTRPFKSAPVFAPAEVPFPRDRVLAEFGERSANLPAELGEFVLDRLRDWTP